MPHLAAIDWDHAERMRHADLGGGGDVYFQYDAAGTRVRKVVVNAAGTQTEERLYLGAVELYRERTGTTLNAERQTLHIADDTARIAIVETLTVDGGVSLPSPANIARYQHANHLSIELDDAANIISYEEFHPYGTSAYRAVDSTIAVTAKRYRYTGKERDHETGLDHMGARLYAPWLARCTSTDPIGLGDGVNRYAYVSGNPVAMSDPSGTKGETAQLQQARATAAQVRGEEIYQAKAELSEAQEAFAAAGHELAAASGELAAHPGSSSAAVRLNLATAEFQNAGITVAAMQDRLRTAETEGHLPGDSVGALKAKAGRRAEQIGEAQAAAAGTFNETGFQLGIVADAAKSGATFVAEQASPLGDALSAIESAEALSRGDYKSAAVAAAAIVAGPAVAKGLRGPFKNKLAGSLDDAAGAARRQPHGGGRAEALAKQVEIAQSARVTKVRGSQPWPPGSAGAAGHAHGKHLADPGLSADIINNADNIFTGVNARGRTVSIFHRGGDVVVTQADDPTRVITTYGASTVNKVRGGKVKPGKPVSDSRWADPSKWKPGESWTRVR